jgi:hypothetical protein
VTGDDAYTILAAYVGGDEDGFLSAFDVDSASASDIAGLVAKLREENEHLRNQLNAASERVEVMRTKRGYAREAAWLRADLETLERLVALELPSPLEELRRLRERRDNS